MKHSKSHMKQHNQALENPQTREALTQLQQAWLSLNHVQRGDAVEPLLHAGCTRRGLALNLNCNEGTVRNELQIAALGPWARAEIAAGANPAPYLLGEKKWTQRLDDAGRLIQEAWDGSVSSELSNSILWFLATYAPGECLHPPTRESVFEEVEFRVRALSGKIRSNWIPANYIRRQEITMSRQFGVVHLAHDCRPIEDPELLFLEPLIMGLLKFVMRLDPASPFGKKP